MAIKPWIGAIVAPTAAPSGNNSAPDADLSLEWVYGYRCFDARNNVRKLVNFKMRMVQRNARPVLQENTQIQQGSQRVRNVQLP